MKFYVSLDYKKRINAKHGSVSQADSRQSSGETLGASGLVDLWNGRRADSGVATEARSPRGEATGARRAAGDWTSLARGN